MTGTVSKGSADLAAEVRDGSAFDGPALELGVLLVDGQPDPSAKIRVPMATLNRRR
jgi:hypothetical protein